MEQANKTVRIEDWNGIRELALMSVGTDKGSWRADPDFGSDLCLLRQNGKADGRTAGTLQRMLQECLAWIAADGLAKQITCAAERTGGNEIAYAVEAIKPDGDDFTIKEIWNGIQQG